GPAPTVSASVPTGVVQPAAHQAAAIAVNAPEPTPLPPSASLPPSGPAQVTPAQVPACPFVGLGELSAEELVREVLVRNPSLAEMAATAQAAAARYPQVVALDDPMFGVSTAPGAWGSRTVEGGYRLDIAQKYPWPGKLELRGANAAAEAAAAGHE